MARTVNKEDHAAKRNEILDAAQRLIYRKGYERMTIQDMLGELGMSNGAFFHYFDSKPAVLEALIERGQSEAEQRLLAIVHDPDLSAVEKLQHYFGTLDRLRFAHRALLAEVARVWYTDENAIVREKTNGEIIERRAPLLNAIVRQGIQEGVFTTPYPDQAGEVLLALLQRMENTHARLMISLTQDGDEQRCVEAIVVTHAAYMEALERVLGAPPNSFYRTDAEAVKTWVAAISDDGVRRIHTEGALSPRA